MAKVYEREVRFARAFLKYIGGNQSNGYLLLAVIAWIRHESGTNWLGNNPLNIRKSPFAIGYRKTRNGNGSFAIFKDAASAAQASAKFIMDNARFGNYTPAIRAARRGTGSDKGVEQALDFLTALAMSKWSADHYGAADGNIKTNNLVKVWRYLTGAKIPAAWFKDTVVPPEQKRRKPPPRQPRPLEHVQPKPDYLQPYAMRSFYEERPHLGQFILPSDRT